MNASPTNTAQLAPQLAGRGCTIVAESGIGSGADAAQVKQAGADAVLVGEAFMRSRDPKALL
ncbi:MAG: indole-3-glycerol-phosphate synthase TrpC, partial [Betaproteobacteria bacterium]|nr:indole-3-glycerol-phosphate synthase TrpC [Betaproteobacteria bacterium]